jgi:hypothetical protein
MLVPRIIADASDRVVGVSHAIVLICNCIVFGLLPKPPAIRYQTRTVLDPYPGDYRDSSRLETMNRLLNSSVSLGPWTTMQRLFFVRGWACTSGTSNCLKSNGARLQAGATQCSPSNYSYHCSESWLPCLFGFIFSRFEMQRVGENPSELICKEVLNRAAADRPFRVSDNC